MNEVHNWEWYEEQVSAGVPVGQILNAAGQYYDITKGMKKRLEKLEREWIQSRYNYYTSFAKQGASKETLRDMMRENHIRPPKSFLTSLYALSKKVKEEQEQKAKQQQEAQQRKANEIKAKVAKALVPATNFNEGAFQAYLKEKENAFQKKLPMYQELNRQEKERPYLEERKRQEEYSKSQEEYRKRLLRQANKQQTRQHKLNYYTNMIREGYSTSNVLRAVERDPTFDPNDPQNQALYNRVKANSMKQHNIRTKRAKKASNKAVNEEAKQSVNAAARNFFMEKEAEVNEITRQKEDAATKEVARQEEEQKRKNKTFLGRIKKALTLKRKGGKRKTLRKRRNTTQRR